MASVKALKEIEDWEEFLDRNYHQMSRRIRVENLLDRLRSQRAISQEDQETILHKYCTQFLKAGLLIDIIRSKGRDGFDKFMESVEYEYPEMYLETTGITPRKDNSTVTARDHRQTSMMLIGKMADLIGTFTSHVQEKRTLIEEKEEELREFQDLVTQLKSDLVKQSDEQKMMEEEMKEMTSCVQELQSENKELLEELKKEQMGRQQQTRELSSLRREKLKTLYDETSNHHHHHPQPPVNQCLSLNSSVPDPSSDLERNLTQLQESNNRLQICLEEFKKESERCRLEQENAETETKAVRLENESMKEELKKLEDQCRRMSDIIRKLKEEIDTKKGKKDLGLKISPIFGDKCTPDVNEDTTPGSPEDEKTNKMFKRRPARLDPTKRKQNPTP